MKTIILLKPEIIGGFGSGKCPDCGKWTEIPTDYTSQFMMWCWGCKGKFVPNLNTKRKIDLDIGKEWKDDVKRDGECYLDFTEDLEQEDRGVAWESFEVDLYTIKKVCTCEMYEKFFQEKGVEYVSGFYNGEEKLPDFLTVKEYKYADYSDIEEVYGKPKFLRKKYIDLPVFLPVNSHNLMARVGEYLGDETEKHLICEDENGKEFLVTCSGD